MENFEFVDALTGDTITQDYTSGQMFIERKSASDAAPLCKSIFFTGCSMFNYAMPLVEVVYGTLRQHDLVDGISLLCCGKILSYESNGEAVRSSFEKQLRDHISKTGIKKIVCACPNCVKALRDAFACDPRTKNIELANLPQVLANVGYRLDKGIFANLVKGGEAGEALLCTHDSCPDREYGEFADGHIGTLSSILVIFCLFGSVLLL